MALISFCTAFYFLIIPNLHNYVCCFLFWNEALYELNVSMNLSDEIFLLTQLNIYQLYFLNSTQPKT